MHVGHKVSTAAAPPPPPPPPPPTRKDIAAYVKRIRRYGAGMRAAIAAGDVVKAEELAWEIEATSDHPDNWEFREIREAARQAFGEENHAHRLTELLRFALKAETPDSQRKRVGRKSTPGDKLLCKALDAVACRLLKADGAYWLMVLKEFENGVVRAIGPEPQTMSSRVQKCAGEFLRNYYRDLREMGMD